MVMSAFSFLLVPCSPSRAATLLVTNTADTGSGSLRQAISTASAGDTISFTPALSGRTIVLTNGQLELSNSVTIDSSALARGIQITGNGQSTIFQVDTGATVTLNSLTIANGYAASFSSGGGILNSGNLALNGCTFVGNTNANGQGGAINNAQGVLAATNCTFTANSASFSGGAIFNDLFNNVPANATLVHCTLAGNSADYIGGGVDNNGTITLVDTIVANNNNLDIDNYVGTVIRQGPNIVGSLLDAGGGTDSGPAAVTSNQLLAPLGYYGGATPTMPPYAGSPAIDAGVAVAGLTTDQRGLPRLQGTSVDIGAVEVNPATIVTTNSDSGPGSLRNVVAAVTNGDLVSFAANLFGQTILVTNGEIELSNSVAIDASTTGVQLSGGKVSRIFNIGTNASVTLKSLVLRDANGGGADGGAIQNGGAAVLNNCTLTNNATGSGAAILNIPPGRMVLNNCTLVGNSGAHAGAGGAILNNALLAINNCTLAGNTAGGGGAIYNNNAAILNITNSTFVGNFVPFTGGALIDFGALVLVNCVLSGNSAGSQGPNLFESGSGLNVSSTLITDGTMSGVTNGFAGNLVGTSANPIDARLAPLGNYGGPTETMPPLPGSPAIHAGVPTSLSTDQRGLPRVVNGQTDLGAVQLQTPQLVVTDTSDDFSPGTLRNVLTNADVSSVITFDPSLSGQTIALTNGEMAINTELVIDGSALQSGVQISGNNSTRIFNIASSGDLTVHSLTLRNANGGGGDGGAILNTGHAVLNACTLTANSTGSGGAIVNNQPGNMTLNNCTFTGNSSAPSGGGGAIVNRAVLTIVNCTLANNTSSFGCAIYDDFAGTLNVTNTILSGSTYSIAEHGIEHAGSNLQDPANINLAPLRNYGGPTPTMPPLPGSPAIDAGLDSVTGFLATDQRGKARLAGTHVDIGAVEGIYNAGGPGRITSFARLSDGSTRLSFTNLTDQQFSVFATTNLGLPESTWPQIGTVVESPAGSGNFQFTDPQAATYPKRFYRVKTP